MIAEEVAVERILADLCDGLPPVVVIDTRQTSSQFQTPGLRIGLLHGFAVEPLNAGTLGLRASLIYLKARNAELHATERFVELGEAARITPRGLAQAMHRLLEGFDGSSDAAAAAALPCTPTPQYIRTAFEHAYCRSALTVATALVSVGPLREFRRRIFARATDLADRARPTVNDACRALDAGLDPEIAALASLATPAPVAPAPVHLGLYNSLVRMRHTSPFAYADAASVLRASPLAALRALELTGDLPAAVQPDAPPWRATLLPRTSLHLGAGELGAQIQIARSVDGPLTPQTQEQFSALYGCWQIATGPLRGLARTFWPNELLRMGVFTLTDASQWPALYQELAGPLEPARAALGHRDHASAYADLCSRAAALDVARRPGSGRRRTSDLVAEVAMRQPVEQMIRSVTTRYLGVESSGPGVTAPAGTHALRP